MINEILMSQVRTLSVTERIELIGAVWETLAANEAPISAADMDLLDTRLADMGQNPEAHSPWPEVQARLKRQLP
jgi:putative addiction module component (TIGR02574 family)